MINAMGCEKQTGRLINGCSSGEPTASLTIYSLASASRQAAFLQLMDLASHLTANRKRRLCGHYQSRAMRCDGIHPLSVAREPCRGGCDEYRSVELWLVSAMVVAAARKSPWRLVSRASRMRVRPGRIISGCPQ